MVFKKFKKKRGEGGGANEEHRDHLLEGLEPFQKPERNARGAHAQSSRGMRAFDKASEQDSAGGLFDQKNHYGAMPSGV